MASISSTRHPVKTRTTNQLREVGRLKSPFIYIGFLRDTSKKRWVGNGNGISIVAINMYVGVFFLKAVKSECFFSLCKGCVYVYMVRYFL